MRGTAVRNKSAVEISILSRNRYLHRAYRNFCRSFVAKLFGYFDFFLGGEDRYILVAESIDFTDRWNKYFDEGLLSIVVIRESENIGSGIGFSKTVSYIKYRDFSKSCFYWIDLAKKEYYCKEAKKRGSFRNLCVSRYDEILSRTRPYPSIRNFRILVSKPLVVIFSLETRLELHYPRNWENLILRKTFDNQIQSDQKLEIVKVCVVNRI